MEFRKVVKRFKEENGNANYTQKEMTMFLVKKVDKIEQMIMDGSNKISSNRTAISYLKYALSGLLLIIIGMFGLIIK